MMNKRQFLTGIAASLVGTPAVVQTANIMRVRNILYPVERYQSGWCTRLYADTFFRLIVQLQGRGLSMHEIASEMTRRKANNHYWATDTVKSVTWLAASIRSEDAIIRAERSLKNIT